MLSMMMLTSCYEDYVKDYDYTTVYFSKQYNTRTVLVGEMMEIEVGVCLGGVMSNEIDRTVNYVINDDLVAQNDVITGFLSNTESYVTEPFSNGEVTEVEAMPQDWYTISDDAKFVIPAGDHLGKLTVTFDEEMFLNAEKSTMLPHYVLPLEITTAESIDYLLESKYYTMIAVVYENKLYGNYWHGGVMTVSDMLDPDVESEVETYDSYLAQEDDLIWTLETTSPNTLSYYGALGSPYSGVEGGMYLTLNEDNTITITADENSPVEVRPFMTSTYNNPKLLQDREIELNYEFEKDNKLYRVSDVLTFRNRVRDGVTEWRDENEENYE